MRKTVPVLGISLALALLASDVAWHKPGPTQAELFTASEALEATQAELLATQAGLLAKERDLASTADRLAVTQAELDAVKSALASATAQVGRRNPTYAEAVEFLREDQTNLRKYDADTYNCRDFSADVILNAELRGLRAAYVSIRLREGSHAVVGFETADKGMVYFEPQTDKEVVLPVGRSYLQTNGYRPNESLDDTIARVTLIW